MLLNSKKGAMFGLDARIALAIFGALSVISGAALYSAIQTANATKAITGFDNIEKAINQYMLDTGSYLEEYQTTDVTMYLGDLFKKPTGVDNWNGPYLGTDSSTRMFLEYSLTGIYDIDRAWRIRRYSGKDKTSGNGTSPCASGDCVMYIFTAGSTSSNEDAYNYIVNLATNIDKIVDNGDGGGKGKMRYSTANFPSNKTISFFYKIGLPEYRYLSRN